MTAERLARGLVALAVGLPLLLLAVRAVERRTGPPVLEVRGRMASDGGWTPGEIAVNMGEPLRLRLMSDDVVHGFGIGQSAFEAVDMYPGKPRTVTLTFDRPGTYTYYCTRWCGVNHWRMRGTIVVRGPDAEPGPADGGAPPPVSLDLDLDAPHPAAAVPAKRPDAARGRHLLAVGSVTVAADRRDQDTLRATAPAALWERLRADPAYGHRSDRDLWDIVAALWTAGDRVRAEGEELYAANCAACHGEAGDGRGVMAAALAASLPPSADHERPGPAGFTDARAMLGASSALLAGKILRGGMGTGMPNWGAILTEDQVWAVVSYLWTFQFGGEAARGAWTHGDDAGRSLGRHHRAAGGGGM